MGVTYLWQILEPVRQPVNMSSLRGKTLAVDLSLWVCEAQTVKKMVGVVTKPHLRNLFFRFSFFTSMGIKLVFVMEGEAPRLKADTMSKRNEMRYGPSKKAGAVRTGRSLFKAMLKECLEMLECLGVPWVQAAGEAEAMCAYLNAKGLVDGCLTNDGDVFLYGAQTVYRNFAMNAKDPHLDSYTMSSIKEKLGCDRESLIGLAVLLGCDYLPKGVPGVGKEQALKLIETLQGENLLQRFEQWKDQFHYDDNPLLVVKRVIHCSECHHPGSYKDHEHNGCKFCESVRCCKPHDSKLCCPCEWHRWERVKQANSVEDSIRKKAMSCEGFPFSEVTQEFLVNKNKLTNIKECQRPNLLSFQLFASEKMEWPKHYACKKLFALLTRYDMIQRKSGYTDSKQLQAIRIVKTRVKNGIPCFEIEWQKPEHYVDPEDEPVELFVVTVEEETLFQAAYPDVVALYEVEKSNILQKKQKKKKDRSEEKVLPNSCDEITSLLSQINIKPTHRILPVQHSMSDTKAPPEGQTQQRSTESKDVALPSSSCIAPVHVSASAAALADSSVPSQCTKYSGISSSSFVPAGLQLSSTDGKETSYSTSSAHRGDDHDSAADLTTCIKYSHPLNHKTVRNSSEYSDVTQSDMHSDSEDDLFSNDAVGQLQEWSLRERILKKAPISSQPFSENAVQLESLNCFKQTKETLNPDRNHVSSSCQLNNIVQKNKNVLSENSVSEGSVHIYQDAYEKADILAEMVQKHPYRSVSASLAFDGQTTETLHPGCEMLPESQTPADATGCHIKEACIETTWKASFKKSVCQNRYSSSDSDDGHMDKILVYEQQKRQLNPGQFKKCFTKKKSSTVSSKRTKSDSALTIEGKTKMTNLKKAVNSFSVQVAPKSSSLEVNCSQSPEQPIERLGSDPTQEEKSAVLTYAWADSPLPLTERLKGRIKIN
ncbi:flap endonuclease GEN homolog 1 [Taeniopygia guttata]|uniref:flap endonuclease GEN homolog 1 n=1 Tax=Taeniopygia guttata TaxID=59729 RepID=UPI003BB8D723